MITMKYLRFLFLFILGCNTIAAAQQPVISKADLQYLRGLTKAVLDSSRLLPGQFINAAYGANNTGGTLIRPGGRLTYPSFWIRDYVMSLPTGWVTAAEQKHMLLLTARTQCNGTWITKAGGMVPYGAIADHIRIDNSVPVYFPGTYDPEEQGTEEFGRFPPYCDQFYFITMAHYYAKSTGDKKLLLEEVNGARLIDRLELSFRVPPSRPDNHIVNTIAAYRGVDFGFRDAIAITGDLVYPSLLKYVAANELSEIFGWLQKPAKAASYKKIAEELKQAIPAMFLTENGMLKAATGQSAQPDVWATAWAVYLQVLEGPGALKACRVLADAYEKGSLAYKGSIRHVLKTDDFSKNTAWESAVVPVNEYQNGAYWGTPTGWVASAIARVNAGDARQLVKEYISGLRENDFRKGPAFNAPLECFYPPSYTRGPVYLTTVSCPYIVFNSMFK
jgi:hypothetical protein